MALTRPVCDSKVSCFHIDSSASWPIHCWSEFSHISTPNKMFIHAARDRHGINRQTDRRGAMRNAVSCREVRKSRDRRS